MASKMPYDRSKGAGSPAKGGSVGSAMREVHSDVPSNVEKTGKKGKAKETMLRAIAFSKAGKSKKGK